MAKFQIDDDLVRNLSKLLEETGLGEIEYEEDGKRIRVSLGGSGQSIAVAPAVAAPPPSEQPSASNQDTAVGHPGAVPSPIVGTVYTSPEPDAAPFVTLGDSVTEGQTVLIVEAMKTMNPIQAPRAGKITKIFVENGDPVEFGAVLMIIE